MTPGPGRGGARQVHRADHHARRAKPPRGYVAPWWEFSPVTNELLLKKGIKYDHSLMHNDFEPYLRAGRRQLDEDRLLEAAEGLDEAAGARPRDRPDRDPGVVVPRRSAADDVHQGGAEQPRLRQPARRRARCGTTSSTGSTASTTMRSSRITIHPDVSGKPHVLMMLNASSTTSRAIPASGSPPSRRSPTTSPGAGRAGRASGRAGSRLDFADGSPALARSRSPCADCAGFWPVPSTGPMPRAVRPAPRPARGASCARASPTRSSLTIGLRLSSLAGGSSLLQSRTGRTEIVPHLGALWPAAERLAGRPCDPLDPGLLDALRRPDRAAGE